MVEEGELTFNVGQITVKLLCARCEQILDAYQTEGNTSIVVHPCCVCIDAEKKEVVDEYDKRERFRIAVARGHNPYRGSSMSMDDYTEELQDKIAVLQTELNELEGLENE